MDHALMLPNDPYTPPVFNGTSLGKAHSDIILLGGIENTFGHTYIINERGNIRADEPALVVDDPDFPSSNNPIENPIFDEALIRTNTIYVEASGDIGNQSATDNPYSGIDGDRVRKALEVELMRINHAVRYTDPIELKEVSLVAKAAGGDAVLDITLHDRTTDGTSDLAVEIEKITAGDDVDVVINDSKAGNTLSTLTGMTVQTFDPPDLTNPLTGASDPYNRTGSFFRYWSPDPADAEDYYDFIARSLNTTATEVDSTYTFVEVRAGDDIDIGHVTTSDSYTGAENRSYRTTDISYAVPDPNPEKITNITVTPAASSTTVNFIINTDIAWTGGSPPDGTPQIFLTTNGSILAKEIVGDMLVGHINSTGDDVELRSGAMILDADSLTTVDVSGVNIRMATGVNAVPGLPGPTPTPTTGGIGLATDYLEINVDRTGSVDDGALYAFDTSGAGVTNGGIFLDELYGDLWVGTVHTLENVSMRTVGGSILDNVTSASVDANGVVTSVLDETVEDADVMGQTIDLDANGTGASIGAVDNDFEIDSRRGSAASDLTDAIGNFGLDKVGDDVGLEATANIYLSEVDAELRLVFAHTYTGDIRLTVWESSDLDENLLLIDNGSARFAESAARQGHTDDPRVVLQGQIFAEAGSIALNVGDNIMTDTNSRIIAAGYNASKEMTATANIDILGDADFEDGVNLGGNPDDGYGTTMILRGAIIAGAVLTTPGSQQGGAPVGVAVPYDDTPQFLTEIFGNEDVDTFQFGDPTGSAGGTTPNSDGYIFLGSKTRAYGSQDANTAIYRDAVTFGDDGTNLTISRSTGSFITDGFRVGQTIDVSATLTDNFDDNNGTYEILSVTDTTITLTATDSWATDGITIDDVALTTNDGEDRFFVYYLQDTATQTGPNVTTVAEHTLTLDGQADTDYYEVHTLGSQGDPRNYVINVLDTGTEDDGVDQLTIFRF